VGGRLWAIEGGGSPKRYWLLGAGTITSLQPGHGVHYRVDAQLERIEVTDFVWFKRLRDEQRSFSYGVNKISDRRIIAALEALRRAGVVSHPSQNLAVRRSPSAANEIVRQLVPKKYLTEILKAVSNSVRLAHEASPEKWGLGLIAKA
jgi:hypothetical protein